MHLFQTDDLRIGKWPHGTVQMGDWWQMYSINVGHGSEITIRCAITTFRDVTLFVGGGGAW